MLGIDARFVTSSSDLVVALRNHEPGDAIAITYRRGDEQGSTLATLGREERHALADRVGAQAR